MLLEVIPVTVAVVLGLQATAVHFVRKHYKKNKAQIQDTDAYTVSHYELGRGWFLSKTVYKSHSEDVDVAGVTYPSNTEG